MLDIKTEALNENVALRGRLQKAKRANNELRRKADEALEVEAIALDTRNRMKARLDAAKAALK